MKKIGHKQMQTKTSSTLAKRLVFEAREAVLDNMKLLSRGIPKCQGEELAWRLKALERLGKWRSYFERRLDKMK